MVALTLTMKSRNAKVGPMPVSISDKSTCAPSCPFKGNGCYAESGQLAIHWAKITASTMPTAMGWDDLCDKVAAMPEGQMWRHNQAGDLPHEGGVIDRAKVEALAMANVGRRGFTYTHHDMTITANANTVYDANRVGFTVNLSANNLKHADELADLEAGPVVTVLPANHDHKEKTYTAKGRRVVVCPATYKDGVSCSSCGLCAIADRKVIVGFPAHGARKKAANAIAMS